MKGIFFIIFCVICFIFFFFLLGIMTTPEQKKEEKQTSKITNVYLNEPLEIGGLTITATSAKETKKIHGFKAKNTYVQTFVKIKNNLSVDNYVPDMSLFKSGDNNWICLYDGRFATDEHTDFILTGFVIKPNQELNGFIPFTCDDYIKNSKVKERNSKPSDFEIFVNNKRTKEYGHIYLRQNENNN